MRQIIVKTAIVLICVAVLSVGAVVLFSFLTRPVNWETEYGKKTKPYDPNTVWYTEGGELTFATEKDGSTYYTPLNDGTSVGYEIPFKTAGTLRTAEGELSVCLFFSSGGTYVEIYPDSSYPAPNYEGCLEHWEAVGYYETDTHFVYELKVLQTTHFREGEMICLFSDKE